jgi:hypothetical protein|tara:strand:+ start:1713 stop:2648 length:936 start_codon:yes stop_codon:yes gene_type:complete
MKGIFKRAKIGVFLTQSILQAIPYYERNLNIITEKLRNKHNIQKFYFKHTLHPFYLFLRAKGVTDKEMRKRKTLKILMLHIQYYILLDSIFETKRDSEKLKNIWKEEPIIIANKLYNAEKLWCDIWEYTQVLVRNLDQFKLGTTAKVLKLFKETNKTITRALEFERDADWSNISFTDRMTFHHLKARASTRRTMEVLMAIHNIQPTSDNLQLFYALGRCIIILDDLKEDYNNTANIFFSASRKTSENLEVAAANHKIPILKLRERWLRKNFPQTYSEVFNVYKNYSNQSSKKSKIKLNLADLYKAAIVAMK